MEWLVIKEKQVIFRGSYHAVNEYIKTNGGDRYKNFYGRLIRK